MRRRPPFALVLVALVGAVAATIALTGQGGGPRATVAATRGTVLIERARVSRPTAVQGRSTVSDRACAGGNSPAAARGSALRIAYNAALSRARADAAATARGRLASLMAS